MKDISAQDLANNFPLAAVSAEGEKRPVHVGPVEIGGPALVVMAGPCAVEDEATTVEIAHRVKAAGAAMLRGGAFKPLTFPYRNARMFELGEVGLRFLRQAGDEAGLPVVTECTDIRQLDLVARYADMIQIGARNAQNFPLLAEAGRLHKPVLLKRGFGMSLRDWLGSAEYVLVEGNSDVVLGERGIVAPHTHHPQSRFIVDLQVVPAVREYSHLPIVVDPSHSTFRRPYVAPVARAAVAIGADGIIIDVHPRPEEAAVDPLQALDYAAFGALMGELRGIGAVLGRAL